ncbi:hypothetical protein CKO_01224 [Citrobacter koseri ATCC BAA-895]|uniref:Uncharacterized protein n=1 Tax=Citrobacter koseri (strain ATCC BAA-895 / CDC 4225-83 / SGSC4696) TaxID=290338 RepID=A8AFV1_CITK8|nr:hypothetical protein CKO_01224 [Citrobacter koseri ATCC BAA-895]
MGAKKRLRQPFALRHGFTLLHECINFVTELRRNNTVSARQWLKNKSPYSAERHE